MLQHQLLNVERSRLVVLLVVQSNKLLPSDALSDQEKHPACPLPRGTMASCRRSGMDDGAKHLQKRADGARLVVGLAEPEAVRHVRLGFFEVAVNLE